MACSRYITFAVAAKLLAIRGIAVNWGSDYPNLLTRGETRAPVYTMLLGVTRVSLANDISFLKRLQEGARV